MPITRCFLGTALPPLQGAAEWLAERYVQGAEWDLSQVVVVTPGLRAGRRLLELLVDWAAARRLTLTPPAFVTEGRAPELLYQPKRPFADELTQQLAWAEALQALPAAERQALLPHPPGEGDFLRWLELGDTVRRLHLELAADGLDFRDVLDRGPRLPQFDDPRRWQALVRLQRMYLDRLDTLQLWDKQTARLIAIRNREPQLDRDLVLLAAVDLNQTLRRMLDLVPDRVTALIAAPAAWAERFDEHGCLVISQWLTASLDLRDEQLLRVDGPAEQAEAAAQWLASLGGKHRVDEVVIGLCQGELAPHLERRLAQAGVAARWIEGQPLSGTGPYRLLAAACSYFAERRYRDFAALVRHPDLYDWLSKQFQAQRVAQPGPPGSASGAAEPEETAAETAPTAEQPAGNAAPDLRFWLTQLDDFYNERLALRLGAANLSEKDRASTIGRLVARVESLFAGWPAAAPLADWAERFRQLLATVLDGKVVDRFSPAERRQFLACELLNQALTSLAGPPPGLQAVVGAAEAAELACAAVAGEALPPPANPDAVELLGWLELPLDDAQALLVTTFSEGFAPRSIAGDPFLPNRLRTELGLLDSDRRFARDAYALATLLATKRELKLVIPRHDSDHNPLAPSRLLFACDSATAARRALALFAAAESASERPSPLAPPGGPLATPRFYRPRPQPGLHRSGAEFRVTEFRDYLACPYRYYLRHVLRLGSRDDAAAELPPNLFGVLLHQALEHFARDETVRDSDDDRAVFAVLSAQLDRIAAGLLAPGPNRPAVLVQVELARLRLKTFSEWQAARAATGWRIVYAEEQERNLTGVLTAASGPATLRGRIDRIDWHARDGLLAVLDYKTADRGVTPEEAHQERGEWRDLQLPLYRHLLPSLQLPGVDLARAQVQLGYINLPKDLRRLGEQMAEWGPPELQAADERARDCLEQIRSGLFWPPAPSAAALSGDFAAICQDYLLGIGKPLDAPASAAEPGQPVVAISGGRP